MPEANEQRVGEVTHYFQNAGVAVVAVEDGFQVGDELHVEGATDDFTFTVDSMEIDREPVEAVEAGDEVGVKVPERAHEGSEVRLVQAEDQPEPMEAA